VLLWPVHLPAAHIPRRSWSVCRGGTVHRILSYLNSYSCSFLMSHRDIVHTQPSTTVQHELRGSDEL
jgi:hypothetical protein